MNGIESSSIFKIYIILHTILNINCLVIKDLGGSWSAQNAKEGYNFSAIVPGGIYTDLMRNNIIGDVFFKNNDVDTRWVSKTNWNYIKEFVIDQELLAHDVIELVFDGLDTFANITVNGKFVGATKNMFVRYIFDVKPYLQMGHNSIVVHFASPVKMAQLAFQEQAHKYVVPPITVPPEYNGENHVNYIRKMQASFAWDWGPAFPSVGIWKPVYLEAFNTSLLRDVTVNVSPNAKNDKWNVQINAYFACNNNINYISGTFNVKLFTDVEKITIFYNVNISKDKQGECVYTQKLSVPQSYVHLWWPNGYGDSKLYMLHVCYSDLDKTERSCRTLKIGFRKVELIQNSISSGNTFYFKVNDVPMFAKGSNVIPINILPELGHNESTIRFLLGSARDIHMNMLRVWGGGVYESNMFYQVADEMGLMIWQDFMFACSMYPTEETFISTVKVETRHQVRRLQNHPSIVVWAANNENEAALSENWYGTVSNFSLYRNDYIKLYVETVQYEVLLNDYTRPFLTSSPTNGVQSLKEGYIAQNPGSHFYGDVHFYNYFLDGWDTANYPITRFASEYGYQSLPMTDTLLSATNSSADLNIGSEFLMHRQHHIFGYIEMAILMNYQLKLQCTGNEQCSKIFVYYSQIIQAMSIKIETEHYRAWRTSLNDIGEGFTMGALYWQLNDVWVAPSWSSIDFKNNWKMVHYYAKQFFAPVIVTAMKDFKNNIYIYVVSDLLRTIQNCSLHIKTFSWDSFAPVFEETYIVDVLPSFSQKVAIIPLCKSTKRNNTLGVSNCFSYYTLADSNNKTIAPDNFLFPVPLYKANLQKPTIKIADVREVDKTFRDFVIEIQTDRIALFVWLDINHVHGTFSDNGFLQITPRKTVHFYADEATDLNKIKQFLTVTNLLGDEGM